MAVLRIAAMLLICGAGCFALPAASLSSPVANLNSHNSIQSRDDFFDIYSDCLNKNPAACFKYKIFSFVDKIFEKDQISLAQGVTVVKTDSFQDAPGAPRSLEGEAKSNDLESMFLNRVESFLKTHSLKVDLRGSDVLNAVSSTARAFSDDSASYDDEDAQETGRKKVKKASKTLMPLLLLLKMKMAALIPFALGAIALIAGKALLIGKIALLLSAIIGLKKLLSHQKTVTYEIVSHPHHAPAHDHHHESFSSSGADAGGYGGGGGGGHGGWGRSANGDAHDIAYSAYKPAQTESAN